MKPTVQRPDLGGPFPENLAIIMDGNGRWAQERGLRRVFGHREGIDSVREITTACARMGMTSLTLYAFSVENWKRPRVEIRYLMDPDLFPRRGGEPALERLLAEEERGNIVIGLLFVLLALVGVTILAVAVQRAKKRSVMTQEIAERQGRSKPKARVRDLETHEEKLELLEDRLEDLRDRR